MNKAVVIYESKYGSTGCYAKWIAEALSCPIFKRKEFNPQYFANYEIILYGGGLYAGGISGIKLLSKNWKRISNKKIILFTCGLANPNNPDNVSNIHNSLRKVFSKEMLEQICLFHLRGGIDYSQLNFVHKSMMAVLKKMLLKKDTDSLSEDDRKLLETYGTCVDFTDQKSIQPLVEYVKSFSFIS